MSEHTNTVTESQPLIPEAVDWQKMYEEQREATDRANQLLALQRNAAPQAVRNDDRRPVMTAEAVRRQIGPLGMLKLTRDDKCRAVHVDPAVTDVYLKECFGRGNNGKSAKDLRLNDPLLYRKLREAAILTGCYGA